LNGSFYSLIAHSACESAAYPRIRQRVQPLAQIPVVAQTGCRKNLPVDSKTRKAKSAIFLFSRQNRLTGLRLRGTSIVPIAGSGCLANLNGLLKRWEKLKNA
jgi:hypothetical protein